ncbi:MAG TPA: hypothetical protein VFX16_04870 [Pseudonocardiaceae bacterium]|nr:hypothetical protein [Pseudonocardiaceae bacterium]
MSRWLRSEAFRKHQSSLTARIRRRNTKLDKEPGLQLQALGMTVAADLDLLTPTMRVVVVEDLCWALAREAWLARRPAWWRRAARRAWAEEEAVLDAKQRRLRELVSAA